MGWEQGLLNLVQSKLSSSSNSVLNDGELLQKVVSLPNTKVVIIYGSKDRIVPFEGVAEKVKKEFPSVQIIRMEGLGHDPFEEDVDGFLRELKAVVEETETT
jgi:pimeloyl-ACP methyl ester carboxylesterase